MNELFIKYGGGALIGALTTFFAGLHVSIKVLIAMMAIDFITGFLSAAMEGKLSSHKGWIGLGKKIISLLIVCSAGLIDLALGMNIIAVGTTFVLIANEAVSITENAGRHIKLPAIFTNAIQTLKDKGEPK